MNSKLTSTTFIPAVDRCQCQLNFNLIVPADRNGVRITGANLPAIAVPAAAQSQISLVPQFRFRMYLLLAMILQTS